MGKFRKKTAAFLGFCFATCFLTHASVNLSNTSGESLWPAICVDSHGRIMAVWSEWDSGQVHYRTFQDGQWSGTRNAGIVQFEAWSNQMAVDSSGTFHLSFADGAGSSNRNIKYSMFNGNNWTSAENIRTFANNSAWNRIDVDTNNRIHVVWYQSFAPKDSTPQADIVTVSKIKYGSWPSGYENVSQSRSVVSIHPAIAARDNVVHTCWMEGENPRKLFYSKKVGSSWSSPQEIDAPGYYPDMDIDGSGNVQIAYSNRGGNFYHLTRVDGRWIKSVISSGDAPLQFGDVHCNTSVTAAAWTQGRDGDWGVYVASKVSGGLWFPPLKVAETRGGEGNKHVQIFVDNTNHAHLLWEGIGVGNRNDIFYQKVSLDDVEGAFIEIDKYYLEFETEQTDVPNAKNFQIRSSSEDNINYSISSNRDWLSVNPTSGSSTGEWNTIAVMVDPGNRQPGEYNGVLTIDSSEALNSPLTIAVNLTIKRKTTPSIQLNKNSLDFASFAHMASPPPRQFNIRNSGFDRLNYSFTSNRSWIRISPTSGTSVNQWHTITVSIDTAGMGVAMRQGTITINGENADNSPQQITVTLDVQKPPAPFPPINAVLSHFSHEGLMLKIYKNLITWEENPNNQGLFSIQKYRIFRKKKTDPVTALQMIEEVDANVLSFYDGNFSSAADGDQYSYAVCCVDSDGLESTRSETAESLNTTRDMEKEKIVNLPDKKKF